MLSKVRESQAAPLETVLDFGPAPLCFPNRVNYPKAMQIQATTRHSSNVAIIDLVGGVTVSGGVGLLRNKMKELVTAGHKNVLLNLRDLTYLDSAGMGELVGACTTLRNLGGDLRLVNPQERVAGLLRMTKLSSIFRIFDDEAAAVQSFQ